MTSKTVPIYRHGRKFYVSVEEYARIRADEHRSRRATAQKAQHLPVTRAQAGSVRVSSASSYNPVQRSHSTPYEHTNGILKSSQGVTLVNAVNRFEPNRLSRSTLRHADDKANVLASRSTSPKKLPSTNTRSSSSDKVLALRKAPLAVFDPHTDLKPSFGNEPVHLSPTRRIGSTHVADYGISPTTTFSMTPADQTHTQTSSLKSGNYVTRTKQSSLNPPTPASESLLETGMRGSAQSYAVLGSSGQRTARGPSSILARSASENRTNKYARREAPSEFFADGDVRPALITPSITRKIEYEPYVPLEPSEDVHADDGHYRWTRSSHRSHSTDGQLEKKRVRFADTEGLHLESKPDRNSVLSPAVPNASSLRRSQGDLVGDARGRPRPFYNTLYQATMAADENRLATDV